MRWPKIIQIVFIVSPTQRRRGEKVFLVLSSLPSNSEWASSASCWCNRASPEAPHFHSESHRRGKFESSRKFETSWNLLLVETYSWLAFRHDEEACEFHHEKSQPKKQRCILKINSKKKKKKPFLYETWWRYHNTVPSSHWISWNFRYLYNSFFFCLTYNRSEYEKHRMFRL